MRIPARLRSAVALSRVRAIERWQSLVFTTRRDNEHFLRSRSLDYPVPPERLLATVAGSADARWFLEGGRLALDSITETLERHSRSVANLRTILDFGCGCGRVARHWPSVTDAPVHGVDYNTDLIAWCQRNLPFGRFATNRLQPPLDFPNASFDLIYALSVFTHLPEPAQRAWMDELARILVPDGLLLITTHGEHYRPQLSLTERATFDAGKLVVRHAEVAGTNLCTTFHPTAYLQAMLPGDLILLDHAPMAARGNPHQDIVLLRKR